MQRFAVVLTAVLLGTTVLTSAPAQAACPSKADCNADKKSGATGAAKQKLAPGELNLDFCDLPEAVLKLDDVKAGKKPEWDPEAYNRINLGRDAAIDRNAGGPNDSWFDKRSGEDLRQVTPGQKKPFITLTPGFGVGN